MREDTWKVSRNITVTAGLRWDAQLTPPPGQINNNYSPISAEYTRPSRTFWTACSRASASRGARMPGTVVRGGYGLFSALNQGSTYYAMRVENGVVQVNYNYPAAKRAARRRSRRARTRLQYPNVPFLPTGPALITALFPTGGAVPAVKGPSNLGTQSFHGLDPNFVPPYTHEMELSVEQLLPGNISLRSVTWARAACGCRSLSMRKLIGQTPHGVRTYNVLSGITSSADGDPADYSSGLSAQRARRGTPPLATFNTGFSVANTWYNALAVTAKRPFKNGLEVLANYTWAHASDTDQVGGKRHLLRRRRAAGSQQHPPRKRSFGHRCPQPLHGELLLSAAVQLRMLSRATWSTASRSPAAKSLPAASPFTWALTGTHLSGSTSSTSYGDDGGIYGGAMSSGSGSATTGRPPSYRPQQHPHAGIQRRGLLRLARTFAIHENMSLRR